jgi:outer membrane protein insertion porin family
MTRSAASVTLSASTCVLWIALWAPTASLAQPPPPPDEDEEAGEDDPGAEDEELAGEEDPDGAQSDDESPDEATEEEPAGPSYEPTTELRQPRTICQGRRVRRIIVEGGRRVADEDIRATMELRQNAPCTDPEVARDAQALWDLGFFDDLVFSAVPVGTDAMDLVVAVRERPAIGRVRYIGNDEISDSDLDEKVTLREGEVLSVPDLRTQVTRIRDLYAEEGYFLAEIQYELRELPNNEVEIRFVIEEGEEVTVRRIRFVGNRNIPADELDNFMRTSATGFFSFIASDDTFNRQHFEEDVQRLQAVYYDQGYLAVSVGTPRIELTADRRFIEITIPIEEGPRFRIGRLGVAEVDEDGMEVEPLGGRRTVREMIEADPGDWFSRTAIATSLLEVTRHYRDAGYAYVEMVPQTDLDMDGREVDVVVQIRRGPLVRIERINVRGNSKTRDQVIRREIEAIEGELYSQTAVEDSKRRITALGYFERVDVSEEEGSAADRIILNFEVAERATGTFQVGAGFSSIESFIFTAQIQQQNFLGRGQSLSAQLQLSGIRQLIQLQYVEPWLFGTEWSLAVEGFKTIRQFRAFTQDSTGGSLTLGHPIFDDRLRLFLRYRGEQVDISGRRGGVLGNLGDPGASDLRQGLFIDGLYRDGFTSSLQLSLSWDSRDNRLFPTSGVYTNYSVEVAESIFGSENVFVRHRAFFRFYQHLFGPFVLKLNTDWGLITSREGQGVPVFERFYLGGIFNVRGFELYSVGPRAGLVTRADPHALSAPFGEVFGGNMQFYYNLEIEFPIIEEVGIKGVVFTDGGNAWNLENSMCEGPQPERYDSASDPCVVNPFQLRTSWGFGIRWISPLGPLRFEWGLPFNPRDGLEDEILFEFTIGNFF